MGYLIDEDGTILRLQVEGDMHTLEVASVANGAIHLSTTVEKAGKVIYIYDKPDDGYELERFTYLCEYGVVDLGKNHTFYMPNADVWVNASFVKKESSKGKWWWIWLLVGLQIIGSLAIAYGYI